MSATSEPKWHVGQAVIVTDVNGTRVGQPPGGWQGTVTKVARKYVTVDYGFRSDKFDFEGYQADVYRDRRIRTPEEFAADGRLQTAIRAVQRGGLNPYKEIPVEKLEAIAAVLNDGSES